MTSRPRVTLKIATSLDGRIGTSTGESQWITGPEARLEGHRLRARADAILVGVETVLADDPRLTARLPEGETGVDPLRVVLDSRQRTPSFARLAVAGTLILTTREPQPIGGAEVLKVAADAAGRGIERALTRAGLVDTRWYSPEETGFYQPILTARRP